MIACVAIWGMINWMVNNCDFRTVVVGCIRPLQVVGMEGKTVFKN
jgi:hypothetical protein